MSDPGWTPIGAPQPEQPTPYAPAPAAYAPVQTWGDLSQAPVVGPAAGPPGELRSTGRCVLLTTVTFGIYVYVYNYRVHGEMKRHSGRGVGAGVALLLTFVANVAMPFITSAEVGALYARRGEEEPVNGWTGLWLLVPPVVGYGLLLVAIVVLSDPTTDGTASTVLLVLCAVAFVVGTLVGGLVWFVRTNGALNRYWRSVGVR